MKLSKNANPDKCGYSAYGNEFDARSQFLMPDGSWGKSVAILGTGMSSYVHGDNKKKDRSFLGDGLTLGLDDTAITAEAKYSISFTESGKSCVLSRHYNGNDKYYKNI